MKEARQRHKAAVEAQRHVQKVAAAVQQKAHKQIVGVVSRCLKAVFPEYGFDIEFKERRGKTEAVIRLLKDGMKIDPREDSGGVRDVVSLGVRIAKLLLEKPARRKMLILDEPFKGIHGAERQRRAAALIGALAREMKIQFLIVSGLPWLKEAGEVVEL